MFSIPDATLEEWLAELKKYQREPMQELLQTHDPIETAALWIAANGPANTSGFGGTGTSAPFFERFKEEFTKFVCGDPEYDEVRKQLGAESYVSKTILITLASGAIAQHLGVMESLIVPAVVVMLHSVGKVGTNAWCSGASNNNQP